MELNTIYRYPEEIVQLIKTKSLLTKEIKKQNEHDKN